MKATLEGVLSRVLWVGVAIAAMLCAGAMAWHLKDASAGETPNTAGAIVREVRKGQPMALAQAGVLVLVLTPMIRVLVTAAGLWAKGARGVAVVAAVTLSILIVGIVGVVGGGWGG